MKPYDGEPCTGVYIHEHLFGGIFIFRGSRIGYSHELDENLEQWLIWTLTNEPFDLLRLGNGFIDILFVWIFDEMIIKMKDDTITKTPNSCKFESICNKIYNEDLLLDKSNVPSYFHFFVFTTE